MTAQQAEIIQVKCKKTGMVFDDFVKDPDKKPQDAYWTQVCDDCASKLDPKKLEETALVYSCGAAECKGDGKANKYYDFKAEVHLTSDS